MAITSETRIQKDAINFLNNQLPKKHPCPDTSKYRVYNCSKRKQINSDKIYENYPDTGRIKATVRLLCSLHGP